MAVTDSAHEVRAVRDLVIEALVAVTHDAPVCQAEYRGRNWVFAEAHEAKIRQKRVYVWVCVRV